MPTSRHPDAARRGVGLFAVGVAVACIGLSAFSLPRRLIELPAETLRASLSGDATLNAADIDALIANRTQAMAWGHAPETMDTLASAYFARAARVHFDPLRARVAIDHALDWRQKDLAASPFDPYGWMQLALLQEQAAPASAIGALRLSLYAGPAEPALLVPQLEMMVRVLPSLPDDMKQDIPALIGAAWKADAAGLVGAAREGHFVGMVEQALSADPEALASFRSRLGG